MTRLNHAMWIGLLSVAGCATTTPGSMPHEMSVAQHEAAARGEDELADSHKAQRDLSDGVTHVRCAPAQGASSRDAAAVDACWTSAADGGDEHLRSAEEHRRRAADHRAGSAALRDAEVRACVGVSTDDRDTSPFEHGRDIESVVPLEERTVGGKSSFMHTIGATVTFRAVPGMTAEWLQRVIECHLARNASVGHVVPGMPDCPLVPTGVTARVSSTGSGFAVAIRSDDADTAREILARALRLERTGGAR